MCDHLPPGSEWWPCDLQGTDWIAITAVAETLQIKVEPTCGWARDPFNPLVDEAESAYILQMLQQAAQ